MVNPCFFENEFIIIELMRYIDVGHLLNSTKLLKTVKKKFIYRNLNNEYSKKYYSCEDFRIIVHNSIDYPNKQICINLENDDDITDVSDLSILGNVHTLNLNGCRGITDVSTLGKVHVLDLKWCVNITDVSALGNVHTLNLNGCYKINDVSALGNVHILNLNGCCNIMDISVLKNVHTLILHGCCNITSVFI